VTAAASIVTPYDWRVVTADGLPALSSEELLPDVVVSSDELVGLSDKLVGLTD
jgi:hypothetical protein